MLTHYWLPSVGPCLPVPPLQFLLPQQLLTRGRPVSNHCQLWSLQLYQRVFLQIGLPWTLCSPSPSFHLCHCHSHTFKHKKVIWQSLLILYINQYCTSILGGIFCILKLLYPLICTQQHTYSRLQHAAHQMVPCRQCYIYIARILCDCLYV